MTGKRKEISAATAAALWVLSNGRCYAPGCLFPVIFEVRPGVYRKNVQIAHIYGVRAPRYKEGLSEEERDAFSNLLLLCLPHHTEVDDKKTGEKLYPPELLREWKAKHEGSNGTALAALGPIEEERLTELIVGLFAPPVKRLEKIAERLEKTGALNAETVVELRQIIDVLTDTPAGPDARTATALGYAAKVFGRSGFYQAATALAHAADKLPNRDGIQSLIRAAEAISIAARSIHRQGGEW